MTISALVRLAGRATASAAFSTAICLPWAAGASSEPDITGQWSCAGNFARSGKVIEATLDIRRDEATRALILRHDDRPPGRYHALELWTKEPDGASRAAIVDAFGGMRWLTSDGWSEGVLVWTRRENNVPVEQFRYRRADHAHLQVDWLTWRGTDWSLGDHVSCVRGPSDLSS